MHSKVANAEPSTRRRAFPSWSVEVPIGFDETFVREGEGYWHAWDVSRSVSLTSVRLTDHGKSVPAQAIVRQMAKGLDRLEPIADLPPGLVGCIGEGPAEPGSRASMLISGFLAIDGCMLILTITADDLGWAKAVLQTVRSHPVGH